MTITNEQIENWFTYHRPTPEQQAKYDRITEKVRLCALAVLRCDPGVELYFEEVEAAIAICPQGTERLEATIHLHFAEGERHARRAIHHLRAARMWANAAIACEVKP